MRWGATAGVAALVGGAERPGPAAGALGATRRCGRERPLRMPPARGAAPPLLTGPPGCTPPPAPQSAVAAVPANTTGFVHRSALYSIQVPPAGLPACLPACLLVCVLACLPACQPAGLRAGLPACLPACWPAGQPSPPLPLYRLRRLYRRLCRSTARSGTRPRRPTMRCRSSTSRSGRWSRSSRPSRREGWLSMRGAGRVGMGGRPRGPVVAAEAVPLTLARLQGTAAGRRRRLRPWRANPVPPCLST